MIGIRRLGQLVVSTSLTGVICAKPAYCADPPAPVVADRDKQSVPDAARQRYQQGVKAYKDGHYKDAIDLFLEADRLAPSAALSFNIARAYGKINDTANSLAWYRDYLRRAGDAKDRAEIEIQVRQLSAKLAKKGVQQVTVMSDPAGATVLVDTRPVGVTPWTGELPPGKHELTLRMRGFQDTSDSFELLPQEPQDISVRLVPMPEKSEPEIAPPAPAPASAPAPPTQPDRPVREAHVGAFTWIMLGAGAGAGIGAGVFEVLRRNALDEARDETTQIGRHDKLQTAESRMNTARILAGVSGGLLIVGGTLLVIDLSSGSSETAAATVGFGCAGAGCGLVGRTRF